MTPEQKKRAGREIVRRMREMNVTAAQVARAAGVDPKTLRNLTAGLKWPTEAVQTRIEAVLRWKEGEIAARAVGAPQQVLLSLSDSELAAELHRRLVAREQREARLRSSDTTAGTNPPRQ